MLEYIQERDKKMQKSLIREVLKNCLPTILSLTMVGLYGVIDGLFVGNATGDTGLAAINISWPLIACINAIGVTIGTSGSVLMSFEKGNGNFEKSRKLFSITISTIIVSALTATIFLLPIFPIILKLFGASGMVLVEAEKYTKTVILGCIFQSLGTGIIPILRNKNKSFVAMICMATGTILNIIVNYYLIFILDLGIQGAALATIFAQLIVAILGSIVLLREEKFKFMLKLKEVLQIFKIGVATFGITVAPSIVLMFTNLQCLKYGGDFAVASYAVISYISFPVGSMLSGVGEGVQPLMSVCVGEGNYEKLHKIKRISLVILVIFAIILTLIVALLSESLGIWFGLSNDAINIFKNGILIYAYAFILTGFAKFNVSYLNSTLQTTKAIFLTYTESLIVTPIFIFTLPFIFELSGVWLSFPLTALVQILIYIFISKRRISTNDKGTSDG